LHWQPVGPEPASTYWTRRAVLLLAVFVLLYGLVALLTGGTDSDTLDQQGGSAPVEQPSVSAEPTAGPDSTGSPEPTPSAEPEPVDCADADLQLSAEADQEVYAVGATPTFVLTVRNTSARPCRRDLGQGAAELIVTSGQDRIWSSDDCAPGGEPGPVVLAPDQSDVTRLTWPATRSLPECAGPQAPVEPGTYVVSGRIGELRVEGDSFRFEA
jgi:hypothetical protein